MIGLLVALLAGLGSSLPPQKPPVGRSLSRAPMPERDDREWEEVGLALPDLGRNLVPYYFPAAGFTARVGVEWSF